MYSIAQKRQKLANSELLIPYAAPYVAYVAIGNLFGPHMSVEQVFAARIVVVASLLFWAWPKYAPLAAQGNAGSARSIAAGVGAGLLGTLLWIVLRKPFPGDATPWTENVFIFKLLTAGFFVPVFEELLMRGYVFGLALQWDRSRKAGARKPFEKAFNEKSIHDVEPGAWSLCAVTISTVFFALGHAYEQWLAAFAYGLLMSALWIVRKDLLTCIVAHGVTNLCLAFYVYSHEQWALW